MLLYCVHCTFEKLFPSILSIIIFVICRSAKKYAHGEVHEENADESVLRV